MCKVILAHFCQQDILSNNNVAGLGQDIACHYVQPIPSKSSTSPTTTNHQLHMHVESIYQGLDARPAHANTFGHVLVHPIMSLLVSRICSCRGWGNTIGISHPSFCNNTKVFLVPQNVKVFCFHVFIPDCSICKGGGSGAAGNCCLLLTTDVALPTKYSNPQIPKPEPPLAHSQETIVCSMICTHGIKANKQTLLLFPLLLKLRSFICTIVCAPD